MSDIFDNTFAEYFYVRYFSFQDFYNKKIVLVLNRHWIQRLHEVDIRLGSLKDWMCNFFGKTHL